MKLIYLSIYLYWCFLILFICYVLAVTEYMFFNYKFWFFYFQRSLELGIPDKFCNLLTATLEVFSQVLEICMLSDVGKYAEEFLNYLQSTVILEPTTSILCVQQVRLCIFWYSKDHDLHLELRPWCQGLNTD